MESSNCTTKTRSSKSRGFKTKLFLCFRPVGAVDDDALEPSTYSSILSSALTTVAECNEGSGGWRRWRKNRDDENSCFWHILKKALNHTTLFFAILCTSLWFYLIPRRKRLCDRAAGDDRVAADEFDSVEYKKKIIMKGLLQRNHSRLSMDSNNNAKS
ncbi:uncharacterized protein G2W53_011645 [Senna tora]|uniref:Transmembrane protein n=1 Tax=Senna tora TaxID=362788 RepID=A0A835CAZ5_9FABA|nr:uncharacterized protein G2W53_011645 [Senna tora]